MPNKYTSKLSGSSVLVIGATSGLGYGLAEALIEHSASHVFVSSSSPSKIASAVSSLEAAYPTTAKGRVFGHVCNLGGDDAGAQVEALFSFVRATLGGGDHTLDHVVYTAGDRLAVRDLADWNLDLMKQAGMVRFFGPLLVARQLARALKPGPASSFTVTTGSVADKPNPGWAVVNAFATGLQGMTRGLALDLKPIRVNCVSPGAVDTALWDGAREQGIYDDLMKMIRAKSLTGEVGAVEDVVQAYLYILKDHNVTGTCVNSNSGALLT